MFLRSVNEQVGLAVLPADTFLTSVIYDGPPVEAAFCVGRVEFISLVGGAALNLTVGMAVQREGFLAWANQGRVPIQVTGDRWRTNVVGLFDLVRGDVIQLFAGQFTAGRVALVAEGFDVAIR